MNGNGNPTEQSEERKGTDGSDPELEALRREAEEHRDRYLRVAAELDNFRKRSERERQETRKYALVEPLRDFLEIMDNLDLALAAAGSADDLNCPNFDPEPGPEYYRAGVGYVIGYNYLAGHPGINAKHATSAGYFRSPLRNSDPGNLPVWSDLTAWSPDGWTIVAHGPGGAVWDGSYYNTRYGGAHPSALSAAGSNAAFLDGSAAWNPIESCVRYETGVYGFGAYPCLW